MVKTYAHLSTLKTYDERLRYLLCHSKIGAETFAENRPFNQAFYRSNQWKRTRRDAIIRDNGCELGIPELKIQGPICVHHLNPVTMDDILNGSQSLFDLDNLVCCSYETHKQIHYGSQEKYEEYQERKPNDTCPWKR